MSGLANAELAQLIGHVNAWRRVAAAPREAASASDLHPLASSASDAEALLDEQYHHSIRLAVYGSLAPGKKNQHVLAKYGGSWTSGRVRGDVINAGWGAAHGYPGLVPRADGPWVPVHVLESPALPSGWHELDDFEGSEYRRILLPVYAEDASASLVAVANIYEIAR